MVDSGATATFIPIDLMNVLGFDLKPLENDPPPQHSVAQTVQQEKPQEKQQAVGAGGLFGTYKAVIERIEVLKGKYPFCSFDNWNVLVPDKAEAIPHVVLGRDSIFRKYDITYREKKEEIVFRKPKK